MGRTRVRVGAATDVGRTRSHNEDSFGLRLPDDREVADRKGLLLVVCDGMGGHAAGEVASQLAVETILTGYYESPCEDPAEALVQAIQLANSNIFEQASQRPDQRGMGTTCVAVVIRGDQMTIAHAGDSRAYLLRNGVLARLTRDHSLVEEWVAKGMLPAEQANQHPMANVITRALGHAPEVQVETRREPALPGDVLMLCSDGLSGRVSEERLRAALAEMEDPDQTVASLIALANDSGGPDNISVIIAVVEEVAPVSGGLPSEREPEPTAPSLQPLSQTERLEVTQRVAPAATAPTIRAPNDTGRELGPVSGASGPGARGKLVRGCYIAAAAALLALMVIALAIAGALMGWVPGLRLVDVAATISLLRGTLG
jgi:protein phosphatase